MPALSPVDDAAAIQQLAAMLSTQSLDLRAAYEAKLRILTQTQREIERLRSVNSTVQRQRAIDRLKKCFTELTEANHEASETLTMIREEFAEFLPKRTNR